MPPSRNIRQIIVRSDKATPPKKNNQVNPTMAARDSTSPIPTNHRVVRSNRLVMDPDSSLLKYSVNPIGPVKIMV